MTSNAAIIRNHVQEIKQLATQVSAYPTERERELEELSFHITELKWYTDRLE